MQQSALFRFHQSLNDFFKAQQKEQWIQYHFNGTPAVKDAIEAIGVPHVEVAEIIINGQPAHFATLLQNGDQVEVYPVAVNAKQLTKDFEETDTQTFILDVHLGALARALRLLGFDARYENNYDDKTIATLAAKEGRIVLTRDIGLLKHKAIEKGYWLRSQHGAQQVAEVVRRFQLQHRINPFKRCLACNGNIHAVAKETVLELLPENTMKYFNEFYQCERCRRVYWKGAHYQRMLQFVERCKAIS